MAERSDPLCAFCLESKPLTSEHVLPTWVRRAIPEADIVSPASARHKFGGALTIADVCEACNNGPLSELDEATKDWYEHRPAGQATGTGLTLMTLARWAMKVAFNSQRVAIREGTSVEPRFPGCMTPWVLGKIGACDKIAVVVGSIPEGHFLAEAAGTFGSDSTHPVRHVHIGREVFFIIWDSQDPQAPFDKLIEVAVSGLPALRIDQLDPTRSYAIPTLNEPEKVWNWDKWDAGLVEAMKEWHRKKEEREREA